jgi:hypothetical protein
MKSFLKSIYRYIWLFVNRNKKLKREENPRLYCLIDYVYNKKNGIKQDRIEAYESILKEGNSPWYSPIE